MEEKPDNAGRQALVFGLILGGAYILRNVVLTVGAGAGLPEAILAFPDLLLGLLSLVCVPGFAGLVTARASGRVGAATFAGTGAGFVGMVLVSLQVILLPGLIPPGLAVIGIGNAQGSVLTCWIPLAMGAGALFGTVGGFFGRTTYNRRRTLQKVARRALAHEQWRQSQG